MNEQPESQSNEMAIVEAARAKKDFLYKDQEAYDKIIEIAKELRERYKQNVVKCYLFHTMIGSTVAREDCTFFDFPGEDSIAKRLDDLYREYKTE